MYSREFYSEKHKNSEEIPVELFSDSFSPQAYTGMKEASGNDVSSIKQEEGYMNSENETRRYVEAKENKRAANYDDLILLGLILMFLLDGRKNNDIVIPVLLAILLLS